MKKLSLMGLLIGIMCFFGIGGVSAEEISPIPGGGATGDLSGGGSGEVIKENTYFKDDNFKKVVFDCFKEENPSTTKTKAEQLTDAELASIKNITYIGDKKNIIEVDVTGIEKLTGLTEFHFYNANIKNAKNINKANIEKFSLEYSKLDEAMEDFSVMPNLKTLSLDNTNVLTKLDISKNLNLIDLNLDGHKLVSLDVTKNTQLYTLAIKNCGLKQIDLSKNTKLGILELKNNELSNIDLSSNTNLGVITFNNIPLTQLNISKNLKLTQIGLYDTKITCLDISKNEGLNYLKLVPGSDENVLDGGDTRGMKIIKDSDTGNACAVVKKEEIKNELIAAIKNPKTGFGLPVAGLGILVVTLGTAVIIRKKGLFRNI